MAPIFIGYIFKGIERLKQFEYYSWQIFTLTLRVPFNSRHSIFLFISPFIGANFYPRSIRKMGKLPLGDGGEIEETIEKDFPSLSLSSFAGEQPIIGVGFFFLFLFRASGRSELYPFSIFFISIGPGNQISDISLRWQGANAREEHPVLSMQLSPALCNVSRPQNESTTFSLTDRTPLFTVYPRRLGSQRRSKQFFDASIHVRDGVGPRGPTLAIFRLAGVGRVSNLTNTLDFYSYEKYT